MINNTRPVAAETRKRVLKVIEETGYKPNTAAKTLRSRKSNSIGVLVEDIMGFSSARIINGISEYIETTEYTLLLNDLRLLDTLFSKYDQELYQKEKIDHVLNHMVHSAQVDAIIYVGMFDRDVSGMIPPVNLPVSIAYSTSKEANRSFVTYDNEDIATEMMKYLLDAGHKNISIIAGPTSTPPVQLRLKGIKKALGEFNINFDKINILIGDWGVESAYDITKSLIDSKNPPTAILAMNDYMAIGAIDAIRDAGLNCPSDISVTGFDNRTVSQTVHPKLTTAEIDLKSIGYKVAEITANQLKAPHHTQQRIVIPSELIIRNSVTKVCATRM